jgi:hypothetical protein
LTIALALAGLAWLASGLLRQHAGRAADGEAAVRAEE